jgi:hypothetical protein
VNYDSIAVIFVICHQKPEQPENQDGRLLADPGTLICMISNNYSRFSWQQGLGNTAFSANQDSANTGGT